jgi:hypothetical protein
MGFRKDTSRNDSMFAVQELPEIHGGNESTECDEQSSDEKSFNCMKVKKEEEDTHSTSLNVDAGSNTDPNLDPNPIPNPEQDTNPDLSPNSKPNPEHRPTSKHDPSDDCDTDKSMEILELKPKPHPTPDLSLKLDLAPEHSSSTASVTVDGDPLPEQQILGALNPLFTGLQNEIRNLSHRNPQEYEMLLKRQLDMACAAVAIARVSSSTFFSSLCSLFEFGTLYIKSAHILGVGVCL